MYGKDNCRLQAKVDVGSREFIRELADLLGLSMAELSGSIIRKFIYEFNSGSFEYNKISKFVIKDGKLKEASL